MKLQSTTLNFQIETYFQINVGGYFFLICKVEKIVDGTFFVYCIPCEKSIGGVFLSLSNKQPVHLFGSLESMSGHDLFHLYSNSR